MFRMKEVSNETSKEWSQGEERNDGERWKVKQLIINTRKRFHDEKSMSALSERYWHCLPSAWIGQAKERRQSVGMFEYQLPDWVCCFISKGKLCINHGLIFRLFLFSLSLSVLLMMMFCFVHLSLLTFSSF